MTTLRTVLVGFNDAGPSSSVLKFAEADCLAFHAGIKMQSLYKEVNHSVFTKMGDPDDIRRAIDSTFSNSKTSDSVIIFFAGHGVIELIADEPQLFLATPSTTSENIVNSCINLNNVLQRSENSDASGVVILLDCCFSGARNGRSFLGNKYLRKLQSGRKFQRPVPRWPQGDGRVVLGASSGSQAAHESSTVGHGLFSNALLSALDRSQHPRSIPVSNVYAQVQQDVMQRTKGRQTPTLYGADSYSLMPTFPRS